MRAMSKTDDAALDELERELEDEPRSVADGLAENYNPSPIPIGPDGGIEPSAFAPVKLPVLPDAICEKGPCRHWWHLVTYLPTAGSPEDYADLGHEMPRQHLFSCQAGTRETELSRDVPVLECTRWSPLSTFEKKEIERIRKAYYAATQTTQSGAETPEGADQDPAARQHDDGALQQ
jgi:hypothetical protein